MLRIATRGRGEGCRGCVGPLPYKRRRAGSFRSAGPRRSCEDLRPFGRMKKKPQVFRKQRGSPALPIPRKVPGSLQSYRSTTTGSTFVARLAGM
jgi:hypothetical protein